MIVLEVKHPTPYLRDGVVFQTLNPGCRYLMFGVDSAYDIPQEAILRVSDLGDYIRKDKRPSDWRGKRVLFASVGGVGDQCMHSALLRYYREVLKSEVFVAVTIWRREFYSENKFIDNGCPLVFPLHLDSVWREKEKPFFDYCFFREFITSEGLRQPNAYDLLFRDHELDPPERFKRPNAHLLDAEIESFQAQMREKNLYPYIVIQPAASAPLRTLTPEVLERVLEGVNEVAQKLECSIIIVHAGDLREYDEVIMRCIKRGIRLVSITPTLGLRDYMLVVSEAKALVGTDSSGYHLAAAFATPAVVLWGSQPPESRAAYYPRQIHLWHRELCPHSPCWHGGKPPVHLCPKGEAQVTCECLSGVTATEISTALQELIK